MTGKPLPERLRKYAIGEEQSLDEIMCEAARRIEELEKSAGELGEGNIALVAQAVDMTEMIERLFVLADHGKVDHEWLPVLRSQARKLGLIFHDHNAHLLQESDDASQESAQRES